MFSRVAVELFDQLRLRLVTPSVVWTQRDQQLVSVWTKRVCPESLRPGLRAYRSYFGDFESVCSCHWRSLTDFTSEVPGGRFPHPNYTLIRAAAEILSRGCSQKKCARQRCRKKHPRQPTIAVMFEAVASHTAYSQRTDCPNSVYAFRNRYVESTGMMVKVMIIEPNNAAADRECHRRK